MRNTWLSRHRKLLSWIAGGAAALLVATAGTGYALVRHLNDNLTQVNLARLVGQQAAAPSGQVLNFLFIGADSRGTITKRASGDTYENDSDTITLLHVQLSDKRTDLVSIPRVTWVHIPSCVMPDGTMSAPREGELGEAFAIPNDDAKHDGLGAACTVKTIEQDTGLHIDHFVASNFTGFEDAVKDLGGVRVCPKKPVTDPSSGLTIPAGCRTLTPAQALAYARARSNGGAGTEIARLDRGETLIDQLIDQVRGDLKDPPAIYRVLNGVTKALTVDSQLGGITGLYRLVTGFASTPASQIHRFTTPETADTVRVVDGDPVARWTAADTRIFADIKANVPVSNSLVTGS